VSELVCCVDFGSTYTKAALVDAVDGTLLATAGHPTTLHTDVLDGWEACRADLAESHPDAKEAEVLACSSAGGGLRIGVVGNEELVTAEAGRRVALSSGGRVVHIAAGGLDAQALTQLRDTAPDVLLLVGGTDGGNEEVLLESAGALAGAGWTGPVVVAGNVLARGHASALLARAGVPHVLADNVMPRIGVLTPDSARAAIREMFVRHVIGGKHLSRSAAFGEMVRGATPDVVLTAAQVLAEEAGEVVVVDIGGATTDVHSVVEVDPEDAGLARQVVATVPVTRTVEGDLGMRWSAMSTVEEGLTAGVLPSDKAETLRKAAQVRRTDPSFLPANPEQTGEDELIASAAITVALRRHAGRQQVSFGPDGRVVERSGKDLREVDLLVGSGGVLRNNTDEVTARILSAVTGEVPGGWQLPLRPRLTVDRDYVLAPAGLLAAAHPEAAHALLRRLALPSWG
jgi:uncharacterized protein (TIGR01319 family)